MSDLPSHIESHNIASAAEEEGIVIDVANDVVRVRIVRGAACATCATAENCPLKSIGKKNWEIWAKNERGANEGDRVKVAITPGRYILIAAMLFIMPVSILLLVYIVSSLFGTPEQFAVAISVILAFFSYIAIRSVDKRASRMAHYEIVEIVERAQI